MKKFTFVVLLGLLFLSSFNRCEAQRQADTDAVIIYCQSVIAMITTLADAPCVDDYDTNSEFCRASCQFYQKWGKTLSTVGQVTPLPKEIKEAHDYILLSIASLCAAYYTEMDFLIVSAYAAVGVASVNLASAINDYMSKNMSVSISAGACQSLVVNLPTPLMGKL